MALQPKIRPEGDERWMYIARRHWMALVRRATLPTLGGAVATIIAIIRVIVRQPDYLGRQPPLLDTLGLLLLIVGLVMLIAVVYIYLDWQNDFLILSNKRVIAEDRTLFLSYDYESIPLERIQNVNTHSQGLQKALGYGDVTVQASGPSPPIVFDRARRPTEVQQQIMKEVGREKKELEKRRLDALTQKRIDPNAPPIPIPRVPVEEGMVTDPHGWDWLVPIRPMLNGTTITWHRHWIVLLRNLVWPLLAFVLWLALLAAAPKLGLLAPATTTMILFVLLLGIIGFAAWQYFEWRGDVYMLDPARIIDIRRLPFGLYEDRREAALSAIQNVSATSPSLVARILGYGDVEIETAGKSGNFTFSQIPRPDRAQRTVFEYIERHKWTQKERDWSNAIDIVESYHRLTNQP